MQNLRNGKPVVFTHQCPESRKGKTMSKEEYRQFTEDMTEQCFSFAQIQLKRLPKKESVNGFWKTLFKKYTFEPTFRMYKFLGGDETCDLIITGSEEEMEKAASSTSDKQEEFYTLDDKCFLKAIAVKALNIEHPGQFINGDKYTVELNSRNVYPKQENNDTTTKLSDKELVLIVAETWNRLNADLLKPYLDKDFHYKSDPVFAEISSREEYLLYLRGKFRVVRKTKNNARKIALAKNEDGTLGGIFIKIEYMGVPAFISVKCDKGRIIEMGMHECAYDIFEQDTDEKQTGKPDTETNGNDDITTEMQDIMESFDMDDQQTFLRLEAAYRHQEINFKRATESSWVTLGEVVNKLDDKITPKTIHSMAVVYKDSMGNQPENEVDETIITDADRIWEFNFFSHIMKDKTDDGHYIMRFNQETVLILKTSFRNIVLTLTPLGGNDTSKYMRMTVLAPDNSETDNCSSFKHKGQFKSENAPSITSFILSFSEAEHNHALDFYESIEQSMERKMKLGETLDRYENAVLRGKYEFQPGAYWSYGLSLYEDKRYYDAFVNLEREFNYLRNNFDELDDNAISLYYKISNTMGHCLMMLNRKKEAAFYFKSGAQGLKSEEPCYLALCKAKSGNPFAIREMNEWMKTCFDMQGNNWNLTELQEKCRDNVPKELVKYHLNMERSMRKSPQYNATVSLGYILDMFLGIKQKNIISQLSVFDLKSGQFLKKTESKEDIYAYNLNNKEAEDKIFVLSCSYAYYNINEKEDKSKLCVSAPVVIATHAIKAETGDEMMRVDIIRSNFAFDDDKEYYTVVNMPENASFVVGEATEAVFNTSDGALYMADDKVDEFLAAKRFVEAMKLGNWVFECCSHKMKTRMGKEYQYYDRNLVNLFFRSAYNVGYCMMELGLLTQAAYYLEIAQYMRNATYVQEYINCLANTNDPLTLQVIEDTIDNSPKPEDKAYMAAWNAHMAFLKRRKAYILIEKKRYTEARDLLLDMIKDPKSKDFAINELNFIDQIMRNQ